MEKELYKKYIDTPIGWLELITDETSLLNISFKEIPVNNTPHLPDILIETEFQLNEYFKGKQKVFQLSLNPSGTTFQQEVWNCVKNVEYGETASYLDIAKLTGSIKNSRAVGLANGKNPIPIIIPCHRIIGNNGKLTGYAGGLEKKRWLLQHELQFSQNNNLLF